MKIFIYYLIIVNLIAFFMFMIDKNRAKEGKWRIPEKNLFLIALLLGSPGCILGMYLFRHKTRHPSFYIGMPVILALQIFIITRIIAYK